MRVSSPQTLHGHVAQPRRLCHPLRAAPGDRRRRVYGSDHQRRDHRLQTVHEAAVEQRPQQYAAALHQRGQHAALPQSAQQRLNVHAPLVPGQDQHLGARPLHAPAPVLRGVLRGRDHRRGVAPRRPLQDRGLLRHAAAGVYHHAQWLVRPLGRSAGARGELRVVDDDGVGADHDRVQPRALLVHPLQRLRPGDPP